MAGPAVTTLKRKAARALAVPRRRLEERRIERAFVSRFLGDGARLREYEVELRESGLAEHLAERAREFRSAVGAEANRRRYTIGTVGYRECVYLYALARALRPRVAVETGVCNGFTTAFFLAALERNGEGELHSIDLPEVAGETYEPGTFWAGKGPAVIPPGKEPGWVIPRRLAKRWTLVLGRSQDELPRVLARVGAIDSFMHDSEHSYECMRFEYETAYGALRDGGALISDDVNANPAFFEFAREQGKSPVWMGRGLAFFVK